MSIRVRAGRSLFRDPTLSGALLGTKVPETFAIEEEEGPPRELEMSVISAQCGCLRNDAL